MGKRCGEKDHSISRCWIPGCTARSTQEVVVRSATEERSAEFCDFHHQLFRLLYHKEVSHAAQG